MHAIGLKPRRRIGVGTFSVDAQLVEEARGSVERALEQVIKPWEGTVDEFGGPDVAGATVGVLEEWARGCR